MNPATTHIWAYAYRFDPPISAERLHKVRGLLQAEHRAAAAQHVMWEARLVTDERISHILVVSDSPELDRAVNQKIEAALRAIDAGYSMTIPLDVTANDLLPPQD